MLYVITEILYFLDIHKYYTVIFAIYKFNILKLFKFIYFQNIHIYNSSIIIFYLFNKYSFYLIRISILKNCIKI